MSSYAIQAHQIQALIKQVKSLDEHELYDLYGIELDQEGSVYDSCYDKTFDSVALWAQFNVQTEDIEDSRPSYSGSNEFME
jgi:hypothetical protein